MLGVKDDMDNVEAFVVVMIATAYVYMVVSGRASVEGFILLAGGALRQLLNIKNNGGQK